MRFLKQACKRYVARRQLRKNTSYAEWLASAMPQSDRFLRCRNAPTACKLIAKSLYKEQSILIGK